MPTILKGRAFICKKLDGFGNFEILDVFSVEVSEDEFNERREAVAKRLANKKTRDYRGFSRELRNELRRDNGGASRIENRRATDGVGLGARGLSGQEETTTDARGSDDGDVVYTQDGEVFAYRVGGLWHKAELSRGSAEARRIEAEARANGTWLKAPNGKPSKLNERQWVQVRTAAFKKWFGDWENDPANASKVVDENGEPLVVYHGTKGRFYEFKNLGNSRSGDGIGYLGSAFYATQDRETAESYADYEENGVMGIFLNIRTPYETRDSRHTSPAHDMSFTKHLGLSSRAEVSDFLRQKGHDGVIAYDEESSYIEFAFYNSSQAKSATENVGTFDGGNADIRFKAETFSMPPKRRNKYDNWRIMPDEYAALSSQIADEWDGKRKIDVYYSKDARAVYLVRRGKSIRDAFDIADVFSVELSQDEFEARREAALREADERGAGISRGGVDLFRSAFERHFRGGKRAKDEGTREENDSTPLGGFQQNQSTADARGSAGEDVLYKDGKIFAYVVDGAFAEDGEKAYREFQDAKSGKLPKGVSLLGLRFKAIPLSQGTGAIYDSLDDAYIDSGEGAQAFGYGHYATEAREEIAKDFYARKSENMAFDPNSADAEETYYRRREARFIATKGVKEVFENLESSLWVISGEAEARAKELLQKRVFEPIAEGIAGFDFIEDILERVLPEVDAITEPLFEEYEEDVSGQNELIKDAIKDFVEETESNQLDMETEPDTRNVTDLIADIDKFFDFDKGTLSEEEFLKFKELVGEDIVYNYGNGRENNVADFIHSAWDATDRESLKKISEALAALGYDAIRYEANTKNKKPDGTPYYNYVIFDSSRVEVIGREFLTKWLQSAGTIYGYYDSFRKELHINDDFVDFDTPIHEWTHVWWDFVAKKDSRLTDKLVENESQTKDTVERLLLFMRDRAQNERNESCLRSLYKNMRAREDYAPCFRRFRFRPFAFRERAFCAKIRFCGKKRQPIPHK